MYPILKLVSTLVKSRFRPKLGLLDKSVLHCRAGITDIDMYMELNNARYFHYMEMGRWDLSARVGLLRLVKDNKWGFAVGGASIRYRRRIPFMAKFTMTTQLICHDGRWMYMLQETHCKGKICSSALIKGCATSKQGLVPATEVFSHFDTNMSDEIPAWVNAWIEAEGQRPWPKS